MGILELCTSGLVAECGASLLLFGISFVFWATLGRIFIGLMLGGHENLFSGVLRKATEPFYVLVGRVVPSRWVPLTILILTAPVIGPLRFLLLPILRPG